MSFTSIRLMSKAIFLTVLLAGLIMVGTSTPVLGAQFDSRINPNNDDSPFKVSYLKTVFIEYPNGGALFDVLRSSDWKFLELLMQQILEFKN